jgi:hypothetical protein
MIGPYLHSVAALSPRHARTLSLHDHILQAYLPYFTLNHFRNEPDVDLILDAWLRSHPELLSPSHHHPLRERDFRSAFYLVLDCAFETEEFGESPIGVSRRVLRELEGLWTDDLRFGSGRGGSKTQRLFRGLAEVSSAAGSGAIASVLRTFFLGWVHEIAEEDAVSLAGWCTGVVRSYMDMRDKEECLRALIELRPEVLREMSRRGAEWLPLQYGNAPPRSWPRRRRADGRRWWDDENEKRIRRLLEDLEGRDRAADMRSQMLPLRLRDSFTDRWSRRNRDLRSSTSMNRSLPRSRSPLRLSEDKYYDIGLAAYLARDDESLHRPLPRSRSPLPRFDDIDDRYLAKGPVVYLEKRSSRFDNRGPSFAEMADMD